MAGKAWVITGFKSSVSIWNHKLPVDSLSEAEVLELLQRLASRHLTPEEVVSASLRKDAPGYTGLLERVSSHGGRYAISVGNICHYTASVEDE